MSQTAKIVGTYIRLADGREIRVQLKKIKDENINPPPVTREGFYERDDEDVEQFIPVFNSTTPVFRQDITFRILRDAGVELNAYLLKYLGYTPYCKMCGKDFDEMEQPQDLEDGTLVCPFCYALALKEKWHAGIPADQVVQLEAPPIPAWIVQTYAHDAVKLYQELHPKATEEEVIKKFAGSALNNYHSQVSDLLARLQTYPLKTPPGSTRRVKVKQNGTIVPKGQFTKYIVETVKEGIELLREYPYYEKTHFIEVNEDTLKPAMYWPQFQVLGRGSYSEVVAMSDAGRFTLWETAQKLLSGKHIFPDSTKGEAMVVNNNYHPTSGQHPGYIALMRPVTWLSADGKKQKFAWILKTVTSRMQYSYGMDQPLPGETPVSVALQKPQFEMKSYEDLIAGLMQN